MNQLGSMSSGGSEKKLEMKLEIGVSNDLDEFLLLKSVELHKISLFHCQNLVDVIIEAQSRYDRNPVEQYSSEKSRSGGYHNIKQPDQCIQNCERCYVDDNVCEWVDYKLSSWLWDYIKNITIIRFFEVWGDHPRSNLKIYNGLGINKNREPSVSGMLSILYQAGIIEKVRDEGWIYKGIQQGKKKNLRFVPLQKSAIMKCREVAKQFRNDLNEVQPTNN